SVNRSTTTNAARPLLWTVGAAAALAAIWHAGTIRPALELPADPRRWRSWAAPQHPLDAAAGAARAVALVLVAYLLLLAVLHLAAAVAPRAGTRRLAAIVTPRFL